MKHYPSIPKDVRDDIDIIAFDKLDGSQIRAEWSKKRGFYKFGTKGHLIDASEPIFGEAVGLIKSSYEESLSKIFKDQKYENVICFFEFFGEHSFAGNHEVESHKVILFDLAPHKKGILPPREFLSLVGHLEIPSILYQGKVNASFISSVRDGTLSNMSGEGVVCKAKGGHKSSPNIVFKIKTQAWLDKLKSFCKEDYELYEKLS